ncbi:MAG: hypothetical protein EXS46_03030 [Candidatus Taylorbacteria bacterium]|nr:hypothetical protein [Candidatus Taylorbacteria bacterium]
MARNKFKKISLLLTSLSVGLVLSASYPLLVIGAITDQGASMQKCTPSATESCKGYIPLAPISPNDTAVNCADGDGKIVKCTNLKIYLTGMFKVGVAAAGILAFLMIVWGGFTYLSTDAITGKEEGKERIQRALGGLILALASYIILYTINPQLVNLDLDFGPRAKVAADLNAPSNQSYETRLNSKITEINKLLDGTKAVAQPLERAALDAELERNEIFAAYANGELDELTLEEQQALLDRFDELNVTIKTLKTQVHSVRDYDTAVAVIKNSRVEAIEATLSQSGAERDRQADLHINSLLEKAKKEIKSLEKAAATDAKHKDQYITWADNLRRQVGDSIRAIRKAQGSADEKDIQNLQSATSFF